MRISDWSSDVCSSDLRTAGHADGLGWRDVVVDRQLAAGEGFGGGEGGGDLVVGRCGVEAGARGGGQRCGHFMALVGAASAGSFVLAPPPAKAGGGWEGVATVRAERAHVVWGKRGAVRG